MLILSLSLMIGCSQREVDYSNLQEKNKTYYVGDEKEPFTGVAIAYSKIGQVEGKYEIKDGKPHGEWKNYYENDQVVGESNYKNGKPHGKFVRYYKDGKVRAEYTFKNGKRVD